MEKEMKQWLEATIRELVISMQAEAVKRPKVLYIFCDSTAHEAFTDHFITLANHNVCFDMLFLDGETSSWLGLHKIECGGPGKIIAADEYAPAPIELPLDYDGIVIPEIDLDNAARAAAGLKGTVKAEILFAALTLEKLVLIGDDAPGLKRADRRTLRTLALPKGYADVFGRYKEDLRRLGARFAPQKQLAEHVVEHCAALRREEEKADRRSIAERSRLEQGEPRGRQLAASAHAGPAERERDAPAAASPERGSSVTAAGRDARRFDGRLLTAEWVRAQLKQGAAEELYITARTIVSPLARDLLSDAGIRLHYVQGG
ncbi:hypothetical protein [Paenibacillus konkukensis]|nr:hypothetical protein [Paenibacillus konkukensis]